MIKQRIQTILGEICDGMLEREEVMALALLSALADESIFLLGWPGVGKSMVARRLKLAFDGARSFEYLMSRFSTPDEIFGPVSITKLKEADTYQRNTPGYLPESEIVFLDEIWKAGPAIQNSLLTVLNEKTYLNGNSPMALPIKAIIAASNELPAQGEGLEALWDRFIIRYIVDPIKERRNFEKLICEPSTDRASIAIHNPLTESDCRLIAQGKRDVSLPKGIIDVIWRLRERMISNMESEDTAPGTISLSATATESKNSYISDRRWHKAVGIIKTSAYLNDRKEVDYSDLMLLSHILWNDDSQVSDIRRIVCEEIVSKHFKNMLDAHKSANRHAKATKGNNSPSLHSPDGVHYVVMCDGFSLKIRRDDYDRLLQSGDYCLASETADSRLMILERGSFAVQVRQPGQVVINGYSYPLVTDTDPQMTSAKLEDMLDSVESISTSLTAQIAENTFVDDTRFIPLIRSIISEYNRRRPC